MSTKPDGRTALYDARSGCANRHGLISNPLGCSAIHAYKPRAVRTLRPTRLDVGSSAQQVIALYGSA
jgi:hypothetical protein